MWPQKWKPSASPGLIALATTPPAAPATSTRPARASRPRREVRAARRSVHEAASGMRRLERAALRRGEDALELGEAVERPLREHRSGPRVERDRVRAARRAGQRPGVRVALLVERLDGQPRLAGEPLDGGRDGAAQRAALGDEDGEREARRGRDGEALDERRRL